MSGSLTSLDTFCSLVPTNAIIIFKTLKKELIIYVSKVYGFSSFQTAFKSIRNNGTFVLMEP